MADGALDLTGAKEEPTEPKKKNHASVKDRPDNASKIYTRVDRNERAWEKDIRERCERVQDRMVEWCEGRQDEELATVIREDGSAMIGGLIVMVGQAVWLKTPLLGAMAIVEPVIAFGRLFKVLGGRWRDRRIEAAEQRERDAWEAQQEADRVAAEQPVEPEPFRHNVTE